MRVLAPGRDAKVDIVFIHSIEGDWQNTWVHAKTQICWPRAFLPEDIPNARILSYGYCVEPTHSFDQQAENLYQTLGETASDRKLLFVAHELGALLTMQALLLSQESSDPLCCPMVENSVGFLFLGMSRKHHFADLLEGLDSLKRKQLHESFVEVLQADSKKREDIWGIFEDRIVGRGRDTSVMYIEERKPADGVIVCFLQGLFRLLETLIYWLHSLRAL